jgi:crotonobetainyl-CoA:carnitine CoA-transferase CaiB-like acyl-CoA transferase
LSKKEDSPKEDALGVLPPVGLLSGVRVLDLTNVLSGPFCTYQLALLGADVIKVEQPRSGDLARQLGANGDLNRALMGSSFIAQNAGKKSVTIDLKSRNGKAIFERLVGSADVVVENFRPGVMRRLGFSYDALQQLKSTIIYCAISGYGQSGPLSENVAYDQIIQGMSGMMSVTGEADSSPLRAGYPACDTIGGMTAAFAIASALFDCRVNGRGRYIDVSMLDATIVSLGWVVSNYLTANVTPQRMGNENKTAAPSGTFTTGDGLLNIAANKQEQFESLCLLLGRPDLTTDGRFADREERKRNRHSLKRELELALSTKPAAEWETILNAARIPAGRVLSIPEILEHPQVLHRGLIQQFEVENVTGTPLRVTRGGFTLSDHDPVAATPPPQLGEHNDEVLGELGFTERELHQFRAEGAI